MALGGVAGSPTDGNSIKVTTLHRAKGLQWPNIYFVGLEEGLLPDHRIEDDAEREHEERRLCFVGVCRAEENLTITSVGTWDRFTRARSRFLEEMGLS